jgi:hypothetical protein
VTAILVIVLLLVCGSSCSGKTTVAGLVDVGGLVVHDFDEAGVPSGAGAAWRQRTLDSWVRRAADYELAGLDVLLAGQSPLGEVLAAPSAPTVSGLSVCLLDVADEIRRTRLRGRDDTGWSSGQIEAFERWGRWHRGHAVDPTHEPEVITEAGWDAMRWDRWSEWSTPDPRWAVTTIDTSELSVPDTAAAIRIWVSASRKKSFR